MADLLLAASDATSPPWQVFAVIVFLAAVVSVCVFLERRHPWQHPHHHYPTHNSDGWSWCDRCGGWIVKAP